MTQRELNECWLALSNKRAQLVYAGHGRVDLDIDFTTNSIDQTREHRKRNPSGYAFDHETKVLREVRSAIDRIGAGTFGICLECASDVGRQQLAAMPWATLCLACQEATNKPISRPVGTHDESLVHAS